MMLELKNIYKNYTQGKMDVPVLKDISSRWTKGSTWPLWAPPAPAKPP